MISELKKLHAANGPSDYDGLVPFAFSMLGEVDPALHLLFWLSCML
jgi:hypothetical protein